MSISLIGVLAGHASRRTTVTSVTVIMADLVLILHHYIIMVTMVAMLVLLFVRIFDFHWCHGQRDAPTVALDTPEDQLDDAKRHH